MTGDDSTRESGHLVVVDSSAYGLELLAAAKQVAGRVTFVSSDLRRGMYARDPRFDELVGAVDEYIRIPDSTDSDEMTRLLAEVHARHPITGVVSVLDVVVPALADATERLGIRYSNPAAVRTTRQKDLCRAALDRAGVPSARFRLVADPSELAGAADTVGFPLVLKPSSGSASLFATVARDVSELRLAWDRFAEGSAALHPRLRAAYGTSAVVEQYLDGPHLSYEVLVRDGRTHPITVNERIRYAADETIELGTIVPGELPPETVRSVQEYGRRVIDAVGLDFALCHMELILTPDGPRLLELNPRLAGMLEGPALAQAWGFDPFRQMAQLHLGHELRPWRGAPDGVVMTHAVGSVTDGTVAADYDPDRAQADLGDLVRVFGVRVRAGEPVGALRSEHAYLGWFLVHGATWAEAVAATGQALRILGKHLGLTLIDGTDRTQRVPLSTDQV